MAEAQAGWIVLSEKEKKKGKGGKTVTTTRDTKKEEKEEDFDEEDESALFNLSLVNATVFEEAYSRGKWLLFLLVLQSCSSFVLSSNEALIQDNVIITLYLTMLVGAGGNAGNQSAIEVITGLATGAIEYNAESFGKTVSKQLRVGALLGFFLGAGSFARVYVTNRDVIGSFAISTACFSIVVCSTIVGGALPYVLIFCGQEPANAGSSVQVCMDVLGVTITCLVCTYIFQNTDFVVGVLHSTTAS
jgi:Mg/Co/Ni transporter MgtE